MKISVIVPIYNSQRYLPNCLNSVVSQDFDDYEVVCVNDGSTDLSSEIVIEYQKKFPQIVLLTKPNGGLPSARNSGINAAKGDYVMHLDSDDCLSPDALSFLYQKARESNADILVFGGKTFPTTLYWADQALNTVDKLVESDDVINSLFDNVGSRPFTWNKLYKRSFLERNNLTYNENIELGEDQEFQFSSFPKAKKILFTRKKIYNYRISSESMMNKYSKNPERRLFGHLDLIKSVYQTWTAYGIIQEYSIKWFDWALSHIFEQDLESVSLTSAKKVAKQIMFFSRELGITGLQINELNNKRIYRILCALDKDLTVREYLEHFDQGGSFFSKYKNRLKRNLDPNGLTYRVLRRVYIFFRK